MKRLSTEFKVFIALILLLGISAAIQSVLPVGIEIPGMEDMELPAPPWVVALANFGIMIIIYGGFGWLGLYLAKKTELPGIWKDKFSVKKHISIPFIVGIICGALLIITDILFAEFTELDKIPHPAFPASIFASISAGISEEIMFRLFFISFWLWLIGKILLSERGMNTIFWILAVFSTIFFTVAHFPSLMLLYEIKEITAIPISLVTELFIMNGIVSVAAIWYFKKYGIIAAIGIHFWTDILWHVVYGMF